MYFMGSATAGGASVPGADAAELPLAAVPVGLLVTAACVYGLHARMRRHQPPASPSTPANDALA
jgi:hypothetical protein